MLPLLAVVPAITATFTRILDRVLPEKMTEAEKAQVELELMKADWRGIEAQISVNAEEAKSASAFVAGWRPFIGWVCGAAFAWTFVVGPIITWFLRSAGVNVPPLADLDQATLMPVLLGMLGLGGLRTIEKVQRKR